MYKKVILAILVVGIIIASPYVYEHIQFTKGTMLRIVENYEVQPTAQGGFAMHFKVKNHQGEEYEVYTGFVAQWNKSEGDYIAQKYIKTVD